jgi:hypothetical protein
VKRTSPGIQERDATIVTVTYNRTTVCGFKGTNCTTHLVTDLGMGPGDGTVPEFSLNRGFGVAGLIDLNAPSAQVLAFRGAVFGDDNVEHGGLIRNITAIDTAIHFLLGYSVALPQALVIAPAPPGAVPSTEINAIGAGTVEIVDEQQRVYHALGAPLLLGPGMLDTARVGIIIVSRSRWAMLA